MSPTSNACNKRKITTSPKATGGIEIKKSKLTPESLRKTRSFPNYDGPEHTSTQVEDNHKESGTGTEAEGDTTLTPESQADFFSQQNSPELTFLTPTRAPTFTDSTVEDDNLGVTMASASGYDSSASANGGNEFPVIRAEQPGRSSPPLKEQLRGFADILDDRLRYVASKGDISQVLKRVDENSSSITTLCADVKKLREDLEDEDRIKNVVAKS